MELMRYYNIDEINIEDSGDYKILGKTITNRYFNIEIKKIDNKDEQNNNQIRIGDKIYVYNIYLNKLKPNNKLRMNIRKKRNQNYWINVGDDTNFYINYKRYMEVGIYTLIHKLIMEHL